VTRILLRETLPPPPKDLRRDPRVDQPWGVQLASGQRCLNFATGAHDNFNGDVVDYYCEDESLVLLRGVDRHGARWTFRSARFQNDEYTTGPPVEVTTAWYGLPDPG